jgi:mRNA-degrading endonuclease YafQ of YafQ-DinJ toxin-antitoxin module
LRNSHAERDHDEKMKKGEPMNKKSKRRNRQSGMSGGKSRQIIRTSPFLRAWKRLSSQVQKTVQQKIHLLAINPRHPSLQVHRLKRTHEPMWICYVSGTHRLLYRWQETTLVLCDVGKHRIVDHAHHKKK